MKLFNKWAYFLSILTNLFFLGVAIRHFYIKNKQEQDAILHNPLNTYNDTRLEIFDHLMINKGDIVFLGTSLTEAFPLYELFPGNLPIKNRGIGGNNSSQITANVYNYAIKQPSKIIIEMGINDLNKHVPIASIIDNYKNTITIIKTVSPGTKVYCQSILPTCYEYQWLMPNIISANQQIASLCKGRKIQYIDSFNAFLKNGSMDSSFTYDGLHLTWDGYRTWLSQIDAIVTN